MPRHFWKRGNRENKPIQFIIEQSRMVGNGNADIIRDSGLDNFALNAGTLDTTCCVGMKIGSPCFTGWPARTSILLPR